MAPFHAIAIIRSFILPRWLGGKVAAFSSSGSIKTDLNERHARFRAPLLARLRVILVDCMAGMHLIYIIFALSAVTLSLTRAFVYNDLATDYHHPTKQNILVYLLTHAAWPPVLWLILLVSCWVPIGYAINPPTMPEREELLVRDPVTLVARPTAEAKSIKWGAKSVVHEVLYAALTLYTVLAFIGSFVY